MVSCAAELLQLACGHPLNNRPGLLAQRREISGGAGLHGVGQQQRIHPGAIFEQLGHGVFAPDQGIGLGAKGLSRFFIGTFGQFGPFFVFHVFSFTMMAH